MNPEHKKFRNCEKKTIEKVKSADIMVVRSAIVRSRQGGRRGGRPNIRIWRVQKWQNRKYTT